MSINVQHFTAVLTSPRYNAVMLTPRYRAMLRTPEGVPGPIGPPGPTGPEGPAGATGATGPAGPQGATGPQGPTGATGSQGPSGPQGAAGAAGPQGPAGPQGAVGPGTNWRGSVATAANLPPTGVQGDAYIALDTQHAWVWANPTGWFDAGNVKGPQGDPGPVGATGPQGAAGATGPAGPTGATGSQGPQGNPGATGPQGPAGQTGATGAQGPAGATGPQGPAGADSTVPGPQGPAGATGPQGPPTSIQDESSGLTQRLVLNFVGAGVTASDDAANGRTLITIPGGGSQTPWTSDIDAAGFALKTLASSNKDLIFSPNATERMRILASSGNVGIGTASPAIKLTVVGASQAAGGAGTQGIVQVTTGTGADTDEKLQFGVLDGGYSWLQAMKAGTAYRNLALNPGGGNVGIGTTNPLTNLHVLGASTDPGGSYGPLIVSGGGAAYQLRFGYYSTGNYGWIQAVQDGVAQRPLVLNAAGGQIHFGYVTNTVWNLALLGNSQMGFYVNEGSNQLLFVVRYATGVVKSAALTLA